jgi:hypothetical protein
MLQQYVAFIWHSLLKLFLQIGNYQFVLQPFCVVFLTLFFFYHLKSTGYGLDGPRVESRGGEIFRTRPDRSLGPPSPLYNGYRVFPGGKAAGAWCWPPTPSSAEVTKGYSFTSIHPLGQFRPVTGLLYLNRSSSQIFAQPASGIRSLLIVEVSRVDVLTALVDLRVWCWELWDL